MGLRFRSLPSVLVLIAAATGFPCAAIAQTASRTAEETSYPTIKEVFNQAFFENDPDFFRNRSLGRQIDWILGPGSLLRNSFPENEISRDAELVNRLYQDVLEQQVSNGPVIRTRDLPNPYETTILLSPRVNVNNPVEGNELIFEQQPPR